MASYQEELMQWRLQRQQQETANRVSELQQEYREAERQRDMAISNDDLEEAGYQDNVCMDLEKEYQKIVPPSPPPAPPGMQEKLDRHQPFIRRGGQRALNAMGEAFQYATQRMGLTPGSPQCIAAERSLLELYAKDRHGVNYDPGELSPTWKDAAKICFPNDPHAEENYKTAYQQLKRQGRVR